MAYKLGLSKEEIALGISKIKPIKHRLEIVSNDKDIVIIDDSYNSNYDGINASLEVLNLFEGRKIVVTPGLVELGNVEKTVNYEFGKKLSGNAQIVVVVGKHNKEVIEKGLIDGGLNKENVIFARTLNKAKEKLNTILEKGDVVLFENDLPDNYS